MLTITMALVLIVSGGTALAFHDGGVARCSSCHTMHNSQNGQLVDPDSPTGNAYLLKDSSPSDTCLGCHANYGQFFGGLGYGPGGDFYWLTKSYSSSSTGDSHGHNIVAPGRGIAQDATLATAPGGDFDSQYLGCTSCHDPHGNQNFRILYGDGAGPKYDGGRYEFNNDAPIAFGNSRKTYPGSGGEETNSQHTVYKSGMSGWCGNCHAGFLSQGNANHVHKVDQGIGSSIAASYNAYISTDDLTGGDALTSYLQFVPFEDLSATEDTVDPENYTAGPEATDQVMCLTCHRAHASPFADVARWDMTATYLVDSRPRETDDAVDHANAYYGYTFVTNQRSLCNKCHAKDYGDAPYEGGGH